MGVPQKHCWRTNSFGLLLSYGQTDSFRTAHRDNFRGTTNPGLGAYQIQQLDRFRIVPYWEQSIPKQLGRHLELGFYWSAGISIAYDHLTVSRWNAPYGMSAMPFEDWNWKASPMPHSAYARSGSCNGSERADNGA